MRGRVRRRERGRPRSLQHEVRMQVGTAYYLDTVSFMSRAVRTRAYNSLPFL